MPSSLDSLVLLAPVLRAQFGVVTTAQAAEAGVSSQVLSRLCAAGLLARRSRGVYASVAHGAAWEQRALEQLLAYGPEATLSHWSAARILRLEQARTGPRPRIELTFPRGRRPKNAPRDRFHESDHFDRDRDRTQVGPFAVTSATWTIAALCARFDLGRAERLVDAAVANGAATRAELGSMVERWWHTPGVVVLRAVLLRQAPQVRGTRSEAERDFLRILREEGLPLPEADVRVTDASGRVRYLDFAYRDARIAIEVDVHPTHATTVGRNADASRQNDLVPRWLPLRFDADDLGRRPGRVADQVRRALIAVGHLPAPVEAGSSPERVGEVPA